VETLAGNGGGAYMDGSDAIASGISNPSGVAVGANGTVYILDTGNFRVRMIRTDNSITTLAGNGNKGLQQDGQGTNASFTSLRAAAIDRTDRLYVLDQASNPDFCRIRTISPSGGTIACLCV
jgi:hypothetical protein